MNSEKDILAGCIKGKQSAQWELYNLDQDRTEQHDLAAQNPERVRAMRVAFDAWAKRCDVEQPSFHHSSLIPYTPYHLR